MQEGTVAGHTQRCSTACNPHTSSAPFIMNTPSYLYGCEDQQDVRIRLVGPNVPEDIGNPSHQESKWHWHQMAHGLASKHGPGCRTSCPSSPASSGPDPSRCHAPCRPPPTPWRSPPEAVEACRETGTAQRLFLGGGGGGPDPSNQLPAQGAYSWGSKKQALLPPKLKENLLQGYPHIPTPPGYGFTNYNELELGD